MPARPPPSRFDWRGFLLLCVIILAVVFLWDTAVVYPQRLFVVLLHEGSHALAAVATGGTVREVQILREEGGWCVTAGGIPFLIASAGYLGSMAFGVTILLLATRTRLSQWVAAFLGLGAVMMAFLWMPAQGFGRWFAAACGVGLALLALLPRIVAEVALRVIAVTSCLYAIVDIKSDVIDARHHESDAAVLAHQTHVPAVVWGASWILVALIVTLLAAKHAVRSTAAAGKR